MVLDSSAVIALLLDEPDADSLRWAIADADTRLISAATLVEASLVIEGRLGETGGRELDLLINRLGVVIVSVDADQVNEARRAWRRFGKGRHEAALNFGDLFAYALAQTSGEPLLFKGDDFARTDVARVL